MNFLQMKYFCCVYRQRSFRKAAEELHLSRQALSKSLVALEEDLGGALFIRKNNVLRATPLADMLYPDAWKIIEQSERLYQSARTFARAGQYPLKIGATFSALETVCPLLPLEFPQNHPEISLELISAADLELEEMVAAGDLEGALVLGPSTPQKGVRPLCLHREKLAVLMRRDHALAGKENLSIHDLKGVPLLLINERFKAREQLMARFAERKSEPEIAYETDDFTLLVKMCQLGKGVTMLPCSRIDSVQSELLTAIPFDSASDPGWQIDFIRREHKTLPFALCIFENYLIRQTEAGRREKNE